MFLPLRGSLTSSRQRSSSGTSIRSNPSARSAATVAAYDATIDGSRCVAHIDSSRIVAPGFSSPACTRPISTCSLNETPMSVWSPPLVTRCEPMRMRMPLAPATLRAGGWISAGMISVVQMPLPMRAAIAPSDWPQRCAPSPESLITSTMCSAIVFAARAVLDFGRSRVAVSFIVGTRSGEMHAGVAALVADDAEESIGALGLVDDLGVAQAEVRLHRARGLASRAHRLDHGRGAGDDVAAGVDARDRGREVLVGGDVAALVEFQSRGLAQDRVRVGAD